MAKSRLGLSGVVYILASAVATKARKTGRFRRGNEGVRRAPHIDGVGGIHALQGGLLSSFLPAGDVRSVLALGEPPALAVPLFCTDYNHFWSGAGRARPAGHAVPAPGDALEEEPPAEAHAAAAEQVRPGACVGDEALAAHSQPRVPHPRLPRVPHRRLREGRAAVRPAPARSPQGRAPTRH
eukprot:4927680-Pyramimonas_sp.AAC.1